MNDNIIAHRKVPPPIPQSKSPVDAVKADDTSPNKSLVSSLFRSLSKSNRNLDSSPKSGAEKVALEDKEQLKSPGHDRTGSIDDDQPRGVIVRDLREAKVGDPRTGPKNRKPNSLSMLASRSSFFSKSSDLLSSNPSRNSILTPAEPEESATPGASEIPKKGLIKDRKLELLQLKAKRLNNHRSIELLHAKQIATTNKEYFEADAFADNQSLKANNVNVGKLEITVDNEVPEHIVSPISEHTHYKSGKSSPASPGGAESNYSPEDHVGYTQMSHYRASPSRSMSQDNSSDMASHKVTDSRSFKQWYISMIEGYSGLT
jgi:hypothetical protein